ncbi:hypothetical protein CK934_08295 [Chitinophaga sp. MD30]|nr:hypothetical protein CK934_08295 [Chitinophaga sp. MD30]
MAEKLLYTAFKREQQIEKISAEILKKDLVEMKSCISLQPDLKTAKHTVLYLLHHRLLVTK